LLALNNEAAAEAAATVLSDTLIALDQRAASRGALLMSDVREVVQEAIAAMPQAAPAHSLPAVGTLNWGTTSISANSDLGRAIAGDNTNFSVASTGRVSVKSGGKAAGFAKSLRETMHGKYDFSTGEARGGAAAQQTPKKGALERIKEVISPTKQGGSGHRMRGRLIPAKRRR
jgi:hypothetical protein